MPLNATSSAGGRGGEHDDAVREHQPVAAVRELARQVAVLGDDRRQAREPVVRGVGGERQDGGGRELEEHERGTVAEHGQAHLRHHRRSWLGYGLRWCASTEMPKNNVPSSTPIHTSVAAAFFDSGRRNAGTPFEIASTPVSATAPDEKPFSSRKMPSDPPPSQACRRTPSGRTAPGRLSPKNDSREPDHDERAEDQHVDVGRDGEDASRLLHPAHVEQRDQRRSARPRAAPVGRASPENAGIEMIAATPAEIDTATVST